MDMILKTLRLCMPKAGIAAKVLSFNVPCIAGTNLPDSHLPGWPLAMFQPGHHHLTHGPPFVYELLVFDR